MGGPVPRSQDPPDRPRDGRHRAHDRVRPLRHRRDLGRRRAVARHMGRRPERVAPHRPADGAVLERLEMPAGTGVSGLESDGADLFYCGGGGSGKVAPCAVQAAGVTSEQIQPQEPIDEPTRDDRQPTTPSRRLADDWLAQRRRCSPARRRSRTCATSRARTPRAALGARRQDVHVRHARGRRTLAELFEGRRQLMVQHFMLGPGWEQGCKSCSFMADHPTARRSTWSIATSPCAVSRAPLAEIERFSAHGLAFELGVVERQRLQPRLPRQLPPETRVEGEVVLQLRHDALPAGARRRASASSTRTTPATSSTPIRPSAAGWKR